MKLFNNKRGENFLVALLSSNFIYALLVVIIFFYFINYGGGDVIKSITDALKSIPGWAYIGIALLLIFGFGKRRRRR